jgi:hypothetical protein
MCHGCARTFEAKPFPNSTPEERLERLRFFAMEGGETWRRVALGQWMQEVERQIVVLRDRLNEPPQRGPVS